ncbi:MAG: M6 family metalloprotease domain-containing protein [Bacteroidota bacterium]
MIQLRNKKNKIYKILIVFTALTIVFIIKIPANAAYIINVPQTITQPDGMKIKCLASGDEFYNWLHDNSGYTIIQNVETGWYVYADKNNGEIVPTNYIVGKDNPEKTALSKWNKISPDKIRKIADSHWRNAPIPSTKTDKLQTMTRGNLNNIVIFIRFNDDPEFSETLNDYNTKFNSFNGNSLKSYYYEASYEALTINTLFFPASSQNVASFQDSHVRNFYKPYNELDNPLGFRTYAQVYNREQDLLFEALMNVKSQIPASLTIDADNDGFIDNICFVIYGDTTQWGTLLWPHKGSLDKYNLSINGKKVWNYNLQVQNWLQTNVLAHEMFHSLGAPDLYHYNDGLVPVGQWDVMAYTTNPPEHMCAYMKYRYGRWIETIPEITYPGTYTLKPLTSFDNNCYKIKSPNSTTEYYIVEYRKKIGIFESNIPGSGLLVYRINANSSGLGNAQYPDVLDEVYLYRPGGTLTQIGNYHNAFFSSTAGRTAISDVTDPDPFLANGTPGGLNISEIGEAGETISFRYGPGSSAPVLISPANASNYVSTLPLFLWNFSEDASYYQLQVSLVENFSSQVLNIIGLTDTTYKLLSRLSPTTRYFWRVKKITVTGSSDWSETWSFTTSIASPTLIEPINNSVNNDIKSNFKWTSVSGAVSYNIQIARDTNFTDLVFNFENIKDISMQVWGLSKNTQYYWHMSSNGVGGNSNWCDYWSFSTTLEPPSLSFPYKESHGIQLTGSLIWHKVQIADSYKIQMSTDDKFTSPFFNVEDCKDTVIAYPNLQYSKKYYWRVATAKGTGISNWSSTYSFYSIMEYPALVSPANNTGGITNIVGLKWKKVKGADSYQIQISQQLDYSNPLVDDYAFNDTTFNYSNLNGITKYFWHVKAFSKEGDTSGWSENRTFTTGNGPASLIEPRNNSFCVSPQGAFRWSSVSGVSSYRLQVSKDDSFTNTIIDQPNMTATFHTFNDLSGNDTLYWRVITKMQNNESYTSNAFRIRILAVSPKLTYPENADKKVLAKCTFTWESVPNITFYHLNVADNPEFSFPEINDSSITSLSYTPKMLIGLQKYYCRIRAGRTGCFGNWSETREFTTQFGVPDLIYPNNNYQWSALSDIIKWDAVRGATNYSIRVSTDSNFVTSKDSALNIKQTEFSYSGYDYNTKYYWQVFASNSINKGEWSDKWSFTTKIKAPDPLAPADNAKNVQRASALVWNSTEGADYYSIQIAKDEYFNEIVIDSTGLNDTTCTLLKLNLRTDYYWRVSAVKNGAGTTHWSMQRKFTTDAFDAVEEPNEVNNSLQFEIYPNPVKETASLVFTLTEPACVSIEFFNQIGNSIGKIENTELSAGIHRINRKTENLSEGVYFCRLMSGTYSVVKCFLIIK